MDTFEKNNSAEKNGASEHDENVASDDLPPPVLPNVTPIKADSEPVKKKLRVLMARHGQGTKDSYQRAGASTMFEAIRRVTCCLTEHRVGEIKRRQWLQSWGSAKLVDGESCF